MSTPRPYHRPAGTRCPPPVPPRAVSSPSRWPIMIAGAAVVGLLLTLGTLTAWVSAHGPTAKRHPAADVPPAIAEAVQPEAPAPGGEPQAPRVQDPLPVDQPAPVVPAPEGVGGPDPAAGAALPAPRNEPSPAAGADSPAPACQNFGTAVDFRINPADATRQARKTGKLLFVLHISGNFEWNRFT